MMNFTNAIQDQWLFSVSSMFIQWKALQHISVALYVEDALYNYYYPPIMRSPCGDELKIQCHIHPMSVVRAHFLNNYARQQQCFQKENLKQTLYGQCGKEDQNLFAKKRNMFSNGLLKVIDDDFSPLYYPPVLKNITVRKRQCIATR